MGHRIERLATLAVGWVCALASLNVSAAWSDADDVTSGPSAAEANFDSGSADARYARDWILRNADHLGRPFAIVDKKNAQLHVFGPNGQPIGSTAVLIGLAPGDQSIPDIAHRTPASLRPGERTTPAGRYASEPGHNDKGEDIVWFDYGASLAIHRLRPSPPAERRRERLDSPVAELRRISFGCIVVPVSFYDEVVAPSLGQRRGIVYVLPETRPVASLFDAPLTTVSVR